MEGYYDLATPYFAANYSVDHLDLGPDYRKNISFAAYQAGHGVCGQRFAHEDEEGFGGVHGEVLAVSWSLALGRYSLARPKSTAFS
jgi:hypothetical protein